MYGMWILLGNKIMTIHMIRVYIGPNSKMSLTQAKDAWQKWVTNHSEWTNDNTKHSLNKSNTRPDGSGTMYWHGSCRFKLTDAKSNLIQKCEDKFVDKCDWYRLGYHKCDHDESQKGGCSWDDEREWTATNQTIPSDIPNFL